MKMILTRLAIAVALAVPAVQAGFDQTVIKPKNLPSDFSPGRGGEFSATPNDNPVGGGDPSFKLEAAYLNYSAATLYTYTGKDFPTFCLESYEVISNPNDVVLNDGAVFGGVGGLDLISKGTAFLYYSFAKGTLSQYDYYNNGTTDNPTDFASRNISAGKLQNAIWMLEGEMTVDASNYYYNLAVTHTYASGIWSDNNFNGTSREFPVRVMNNWDPSSPHTSAYANQDHLIVVPEPSTYIAAGLLGVPFLVSVWRRRSAQR